MTVQIPLRDEELEVARISIESALELKYPPDWLEVQVIDNSDSPDRCLPIKQPLKAKISQPPDGGKAVFCPDAHGGAVRVPAGTGLPTNAHATLLFFKGKHSFPVTGKGLIKPLPLVDLLRVNAFGLGSSVVFFVITVLWLPTPTAVWHQTKSRSPGGIDCTSITE